MKTILIVDDENDILEIIAEYAKQEGYTTILARNGESALKSFEENSIDLIILDIMLPDLNGYEVAERIRKIENVPIIMLSAKSQEADEIETKLENCDGTRQEKIGQEYGVRFGKGEEVCQNRENCENYEERNKNGKNQEEGQMKRKGNGVCDGTGNGTGLCKKLSK